MDTATIPQTSEALREGVAICGSQAAFERRTGAKQQKVSYWIKHNKPIAAEYVLAAERETGISRHRYRPDLYPEEPSSAPCAPINDGTDDAHCDRQPASQRDAA